ncbi:MAG: helix-turn-helix transcriptional regulator [Coriobacteriales bacterium]|jgi:predicted transcriptional regulator YheO|nr:helix-turn-helix transcriptional regulator [Coriobacteriales bacterium]
MPDTHEFEQIRPILSRIAIGLARHFGPECEVVIHDTTHGADGTIAVIENGHVTGRKVGDSASETVLEALKNRDISDRYSYVTNTKDGKMLKSSTINLHNEAGEVVAVVCLNYDISRLMLADRSLQGLLSVEDGGQGAATIPDNVNDLLDQLIDESHRLVGKPIAFMTKEEKAEAIRFLDSKGALLIKKSSERIANYYGISKYTLYNYLGSQEEK